MSMGYGELAAEIQARLESQGDREVKKIRPAGDLHRTPMHPAILSARPEEEQYPSSAPVTESPR